MNNLKKTKKKFGTKIIGTINHNGKPVNIYLGVPNKESNKILRDMRNGY